MHAVCVAVACCRFVGHKAEDATNVAIDAAEGVAKHAVKHRVAKALGAF